MDEKVDDLYLPNTVLLRIIRDSLPERTVISREARSAISKSASSFILYVTSLASAHCESAKRKTLLACDIFAALKEMQFDHFTDELNSFLEHYRTCSDQKKATKRGASTLDTETDHISQIADPDTIINVPEMSISVEHQCDTTEPVEGSFTEITSADIGDKT